MSVAVGPGWTLLTVIARETRSIATPRIIEAIAPLVIEYMLAPGNAVLPAVLLSFRRRRDVAQKLGVLEVHGAQAPGPLLIIAGRGHWEDEYTRASGSPLDVDRHGAGVHLAADLHPSRRRRGKSGKGSRV